MEKNTERFLCDNFNTPEVLNEVANLVRVTNIYMNQPNAV